jgi:hypothetical protein
MADAIKRPSTSDVAKTLECKKGHLLPLVCQVFASRRSPIVYQSPVEPDAGSDLLLVCRASLATWHEVRVRRGCEVGSTLRVASRVADIEQSR